MLVQFFHAERSGHTAALVLATSLVRLQNVSANTSLVRVNGTTYTLLPGETTAVTVPAGTFSYEVLADGRGFAHVPRCGICP